MGALDCPMFLWLGQWSAERGFSVHWIADLVP